MFWAIKNGHSEPTIRRIVMKIAFNFTKLQRHIEEIGKITHNPEKRNSRFRAGFLLKFFGIFFFRLHDFAHSDNYEQFMESFVHDLDCLLLGPFSDCFKSNGFELDELRKAYLEASRISVYSIPFQPEYREFLNGKIIFHGKKGRVLLYVSWVFDPLSETLVTYKLCKLCMLCN